MSPRCAKCQCAPQECLKQNPFQCTNCIKTTCCCLTLHSRPRRENRPPSLLFSYLGYVKGFYAAALGIEILCITAAEIGENTALYWFGFNPPGIVIAYVMGYALAGFTTFVTILGRYDYRSRRQDMCSC